MNPIFPYDGSITGASGSGTWLYLEFGAYVPSGATPFQIFPTGSYADNVFLQASITGTSGSGNYLFLDYGTTPARLVGTTVDGIIVSGSGTQPVLLRFKPYAFFTWC